MLPYRLEISHVLWQQQGVLHFISNILSCALLEVSDGGIAEKRSSIHLHAWGLG